MQKIIIKDAPDQGHKQTRLSELKHRQWYKAQSKLDSIRPIMFMLDGSPPEPSTGVRMIMLEECHVVGHDPRIMTYILVHHPSHIMWDVEPVTLDSVTFVKQGAV